MEDDGIQALNCFKVFSFTSGTYKLRVLSQEQSVFHFWKNPNAATNNVKLTTFDNVGAKIELTIRKL